MEVSDDSSIQLNLFSLADYSTDERRQKISGKRGDRIRARRLEKYKKKKEDVQEDGYTNEDRIKGQSQLADSPFKKSVQKEYAAQKPTGVISSLFRNNPKIPIVERSSVEQVKEKVFSSETFQQLPLHPYLVSNLEKLGFTKMTSVQQQTVPTLLDGHDALVKSQTGSGKTLAYTIPIVQKLQELSPPVKRSDGLHAVVIVPTRELAIQSFETFQKVLKPFMRIVPGCFMGGEKRKAEKARLRKGINILISTPGRLLDHMDHSNNLQMMRVRWLVLDEADRLLDLGYEKDVARIMTGLRNQSQAERIQSVLLSATLTQGVERLAGISLESPCRIDISQDSKSTKQVQKEAVELSHNSGVTKDCEKESVDTAQDSFALPENLKQHFIITPCKLRLVTLTAFILSKCKAARKASKMIVFLSSKDSVEFHYRLLQFLTLETDSDVELEETESLTQTHSIELYRLHGSMEQKERTTVFKEFCKVKSGVLLCTDVAARGLHLPHVDWIVQYTSPGGATDYIHRVGRTARVGSEGNSVLFLMPAETEYVKLLNDSSIYLEEMQMSGILKSLLKVLDTLPQVQEPQRLPPRTTEEAATYLQMSIENHILENSKMADLAKTAFQSFVRAYATYPSSLKKVFHVRNLHLGHVAKSFGLRDAPMHIGGVQAQLFNTGNKRKRKQDFSSKSGPKPKKMKDISEFSSALVFTSKKKKVNHAKKKKKVKK